MRRTAATAALTALAATAMAGLGPENVAVVVNGDSPTSILVANEYLKLRDIPRGNMVVLHHIGATEEVSAEVFRTLILAPIRQTLQARGLTKQIDCIAYSADVPYAVNISADFQGQTLSQVYTLGASTNGLTYLGDWVANKDPQYLQLGNNRYARNGDQMGVGFRSAYGWNLSGNPAPSGPHYMLSTFLGVTAGRGNTLQEVFDSLRRAKAADSTRPKGTIYFEQNGDVRSKVREWGFQHAVSELKSLGVNAEIEDGIIPLGHNDVAGAMVGTATFDWRSSSSTILPGAICEHFTSYGGNLKTRAGQTPCTVWIANGAAGTSGTVTEPYAVQPKFPTPFMQVLYAKGFTLAEAYYMTVSGPYQLLIIGDPLCAPWKRRAHLSVALPPTLKGKVQLRPHLSPSFAVARYELYVDGKFSESVTSKTALVLNTSNLLAGRHTVSVLARCADEPGAVYRSASTATVLK